MLEDLFKNNKLEYIHINANKDKNIIKRMTISNNLGKLRVLYIKNRNDRINITLNI